VAGLAGAAATAIWLARVLPGYFAQPLNDRSAWAGVIGMFLTAFGLLVSLAALGTAVAQLRQDSRGPAVHPRPDRGPGQPGAESLAAPVGLLDKHVQGRDGLVGDLARDCRRNWWIRRPGLVHVLVGMGGGGKTTVALSVASRVAGRVRVWWISAENPTVLQTGLRRLAGELGASEAEVERAWTGLDSATDLLSRRLTAYPNRWLLVLDNADDTRLLAAPGQPVAAGTGWLRPISSRQGTVLVTSRDTDPDTWGGWCELHRVGMLAAAVGARVLLDHTGPAAGTTEQAAALARRLDGLPLALRLAGRYLAAAGRMPLPGAVATFDGYSAALDAGRLSAVFDHADDAVLDDTQSRGVIDRTWELSLDLLDQRGLGPARTLLRLLALFGAAPIPYQLLLDPGQMADSDLFPSLDTPRLYELLHALAGLGLLDLTPSDGQETPTGANGSTDPVTLRLHPLLRDTSRHHLTRSGQTPTYLRLATRLLYQATQQPGTGNPDDPATWPTWQTITPHPPGLRLS